MLKLFGVAIFLSAALLFLVQPMSGKVLLPLLGGSPAVWNTCMVFFQAVLLLGYGYAHFLSKHVPLKWQPIVHVSLLVVAGVTLPAPVDVGEPGDANPVFWVVKILAITIGLPFLVVSTSGPLLQRWFSRTDHPQAKDPYFLYAASNAGSVLGLLAYPFVIEPNLSRSGQSDVWRWLYWVMAPLIAACAWMMLRVARGGEPALAPTAAPTWRQRWLWVALAFVPSSLMIGVTQSISTDVAAVPLLWIVPLLLYLLSFILAFSNKWGWSAAGWGRLFPLCLVPLMVVMVLAAKQPVLVILFIHLATFFVGAMMCHRRLAEIRPDATHLTEFYLALSVGGVLGGVFNALLAPVMFNEIVEYPLVLALDCLLRPGVFAGAEWAWRPGALSPRGRKFWRSVCAGVVVAFLLFVYQLNLDAAIGSNYLGKSEFGQFMMHDLQMSERTFFGMFRAGVPLVVCLFMLFFMGVVPFTLSSATLLVGALYVSSGVPLLLRDRTFFGVIRVNENQDRTWHVMSHGTTVHGQQARTEDLRRPGEIRPDPATRERLFWGVGKDELPRDERVKWLNALPTSYYHPTGPIGEVIHVLQRAGRLTHGGFIGLGAGSLAAYARPGDDYTYFEIDPEVRDIARNPRYFTYLNDALQCGVHITVYTGDGRLNLRAEPDASYDLIAVDAFTSDAIPMHLITREAVEIYMRKLKPQGVLAFHISNRYFDLSPVLARIADVLHLTCWALDDKLVLPIESRQGKKESVWVVLARSDADLGSIATYPTRWTRFRSKPGFPLWTDDYSNLFSVFVGWGMGTAESGGDTGR